MTMVDGSLRAGCLRVESGRLVVAVRLPWYRSLPLSCVESVDVAVGGRPVGVHAVGPPGVRLAVDALAADDRDWDLRDPLDVVTGAAARPGEEVDVAVTVVVRIPYLTQAPGVPLVQRVTLRHRDVVRDRESEGTS